MEIRLPEISRDSSEAVLTLWHAAESDHVSEGQDLFEVVTDKAAFDVSAPVSGKLKRIIKKPGESLKKDDVVGEIEEDRRKRS